MEPVKEPDTLVLGDVHSHLDRLEALLLQEGIIGDCPVCEGTGESRDDDPFCVLCDGTGLARINHDVKVIQLGDLGHFGGGYTADLLTYQFGIQWLDEILWGNHDRAVIQERAHSFGGYAGASPETRDLMDDARNKGKLKLASAAHGFLLTHAGLHSEFKHNDAPAEVKQNPQEFAAWMNAMDARDDGVNAAYGPTFIATRDNISTSRGGRARAGGILWRDASESLYPGFRQIFGHSAGRKVRRYQSKFAGDSYCVDIGSEHNGHLAGIWLPSERVVEVEVGIKPVEVSDHVIDDGRGVQDSDTGSGSTGPTAS